MVGIAALLAFATRAANAQDAVAPVAAEVAPSANAARADEAFRAGKEKLAAQDYAAACPLLAESYALETATGTLLALALCHERAGQTEDARREYLEAAERSKSEGRADREQAARERAAALAPKEPEPAPAPAPAVEAVSEPEPTPAADPIFDQPRQGRRSSGLSIGQWVGLGTMGAGAVSFIVAGGLAVHAVNRDEDSRRGCDGDLCTASARQDRLDAREAGDGASLALLLGGALATTGVVLFFATAPRGGHDYALTPVLSPRAAGATLRGAF